MREHSTRLQDVRADLQEVQGRIQRIEADLQSLDETGGWSNGNGSKGSPNLDLGRINSSLNELGAQRSQGDILAAYLEQSAPFFDRGVLFLRKDSRYVAWQAVGYDVEEIEAVALDGADSAVARAAEQRVLISEREGLSEKFPWIDSDDQPEHSVCVPLVFDDSAPVVLYADSKGDVDRDSLELLTQLTVLVLKNHYLSYLSLKPTAISEIDVSGLEPSTAFPESDRESAEVALGTSEQSTENGWDNLKARDPEWDASPGEDTDEDDSVITGIPPFDSELADDDEGIETAGEEQLTKDQPGAAASKDDEQAEGIEASVGESDKAGPVWADSESPETDEADVDASAESWELAADDEEEQSVGASESRWLDDRLRSDSGDSEKEAQTPDKKEQAGISSEDSAEEAPHAEARRFARLLVSEIKLYNVGAIEEGRKERDLYSRLQRDIDRSREMYEKRVHPSVRTETDYFHEEVLRILAADDQEALGSGYPGPQIED